MVLDLGIVLLEIKKLQEEGVSTKNLVISEKAHIIMPYHFTMDDYQENLKGDKKIGTTRRGIGPAYMDKVARQGIRLMDLLAWQPFLEKLDYNLREKNEIFRRAGLPLIEGEIKERLIADFAIYREQIAPYVGETIYLVNEALAAGQKLLFEGAQGSMLDLDHGTYPFVTSSNTVAAGSCTGVGIGPTRIDKVLGVAKAYCTRVGEGPFPTELKDETGDNLRNWGNEFGVTTGRTRRVGWFDSVVVRYSALVNGMTDLCLTKLDILDKLPEIKVCTGYSQTGHIVTKCPARWRNWPNSSRFTKHCPVGCPTPQPVAALLICRKTRKNMCCAWRSSAACRFLWWLWGRTASRLLYGVICFNQVFGPLQGKQFDNKIKY